MRLSRLLVTVTATEKSASYPSLTIIGISIAPIEETSATAEPLIPPKSIEAMMFTWARPPRICPTSALEKWTRRRLIPLGS